MAFDDQRFNEWQGAPNIRYSKNITMEWDPDQHRYIPVSHTSRVKGGPIVEYEGIRFTRFHAVGAYPTEAAKKRGIMEWFYSNDLLGRVIFRSNDSQTIEGINPESWGGEVPLQEFHEAINDITGAKDWLQDYQEAEFVYEIGSSVYYFTAQGKRRLRVFIQRNTRASERTFTDKRAKEIDKKRKEYRKRKPPKKGSKR